MRKFDTPDVLQYLTDAHGGQRTAVVIANIFKVKTGDARALLDDLAASGAVKVASNHGRVYFIPLPDLVQTKFRKPFKQLSMDCFDSVRLRCQELYPDGRSFIPVSGKS